MMNCKLRPIAFLVVCAIVATAPPLRSADEPKSEPPDRNMPAEERTVTKVYDVRALSLPCDEFGFDTAPHSNAFVIPGNLQGFYGESGTQGGPAPTSAELTAELIDRLVKLLTDTVAPDSWRVSGGTLGTIREMDGMLVVTQTPANQKVIAALLHELAELRTQTVRISADWLLVRPADVEKLLNDGSSTRASHDAARETEHRAMREVDPAALKTLPPSARHFHAELTSRNGQTVHFISGRERTVTVTQVGSVGTDVAAYTPVVGNVGDGIALQVNAAVNHEQHSVLVTLFSTFNDGQEPGPPIAVRMAPSTQPSSNDRGDLSDASATYRELNAVVQELRTTVRIPLDMPVIVGAMTLEPSAKNTDAQQLVLILRIQSAE